MLTAEQILEVKDLNEKDIEVKEWGGSIKIREFTAKQRQEFTKAFAEDIASDEALVKIVSLAAIKEDGSPLFTEEQAQQLKEKSGVILERLAEEVLKLNGLNQNAAKDAKGN